MVCSDESFWEATPPSSKKLLLVRVAYQVVNLISIACEVLVDQVEGIPAEEYSLIKSLSLSICCKSLVHKVANVKLNSGCESLFLHEWATIASEGEFFTTDGFQFVHDFRSS